MAALRGRQQVFSTLSLAERKLRLERLRRCHLVLLARGTCLVERGKRFLARGERLAFLPLPPQSNRLCSSMVRPLLEATKPSVEEVNSTKPGRMAGLRLLRVLPLPQARDEIAVTLGRLLPLRPHLSQRVWDAGEQSVADRRDELRRNTNVRRLLVVVGKAE